MRGSDERTGSLFSYVDLEDRVPAKHPLRVIRCIVNDVLAALDGEFAKIYAESGRPSIHPSGCCGRSCCRRSIRSAPRCS
jgi:transposase